MKKEKKTFFLIEKREDILTSIEIFLMRNDFLLTVLLLIKILFCIFLKKGRHLVSQLIDRNTASHDADAEWVMVPSFEIGQAI